MAGRRDAKQRMKHLQTVADKVLACIESTVDAWEAGPSDKQNIRQITGALKDLQDIQSVTEGGVSADREMRVILQEAQEYIQ